MAQSFKKKALDYLQNSKCPGMLSFCHYSRVPVFGIGSSPDAGFEPVRSHLNALQLIIKYPEAQNRWLRQGASSPKAQFPEGWQLALWLQAPGSKWLRVISPATKAYACQERYPFVNS